MLPATTAIYFYILVSSNCSCEEVRNSRALARMQPRHLVRTVTIYLREFSRGGQPSSTLSQAKRVLRSGSNANGRGRGRGGGFLVFKYSAIRASSNGQESPSRIHCRAATVLFSFKENSTFLFLAILSIISSAIESGVDSPRRRVLIWPWEKKSRRRAENSRITQDDVLLTLQGESKSALLLRLLKTRISRAGE